MDECVQKGQDKLDKIIAWCDLNKLTINVKKNKSMIIKPKNDQCDLNLYISPNIYKEGQKTTVPYCTTTPILCPHTPYGSLMLGPV